MATDVDFIDTEPLNIAQYKLNFKKAQSFYNFL